MLSLQTQCGQPYTVLLSSSTASLRSSEVSLQVRSEMSARARLKLDERCFARRVKYNPAKVRGNGGLPASRAFSKPDPQPLILSAAHSLTIAPMSMALSRGEPIRSVFMRHLICRSACPLCSPASAKRPELRAANLPCGTQLHRNPPPALSRSASVENNEGRFSPPSSGVKAFCGSAPWPANRAAHFCFEPERNLSMS